MKLTLNMTAKETMIIEMLSGEKIKNEHNTTKAATSTVIVSDNGAADFHLELNEEFVIEFCKKFNKIVDLCKNIGAMITPLTKEFKDFYREWGNDEGNIIKRMKENNMRYAIIYKEKDGVKRESFYGDADYLKDAIHKLPLSKIGEIKKIINVDGDTINIDDVDNLVCPIKYDIDPDKGCGEL